MPSEKLLSHFEALSPEALAAAVSLVQSRPHHPPSQKRKGPSLHQDPCPHCKTGFLPSPTGKQIEVHTYECKVSEGHRVLGKFFRRCKKCGKIEANHVTCMIGRADCQCEGRLEVEAIPNMTGLKLARVLLQKGAPDAGKVRAKTIWEWAKGNAVAI